MAGANTDQMEFTMRSSGFALVFMLAAETVFAHDSRVPNGARVKDLGPFHAELTATGSTIELYVTDTANKAVAVDGYKDSSQVRLNDIETSVSVTRRFIA